MQHEIISPPDLIASINSVLEHLESNSERREALAHANLLLTNVMILLRPIRIKNRQPDGPRTYTLADKCQWHLKKVRRLKASLVRGVKEIENGEYLLARTTFMHAREAWRADSPLIRFPERG